MGFDLFLNARHDLGRAQVDAGGGSQGVEGGWGTGTSEREERCMTKI
jgi:hypothetical protein